MQTDIVKLIRKYTFLTRVGRYYKGLCPFRIGEEKEANLVVHRPTGKFRCLGCGMEGNAEDFDRIINGMNKKNINTLIGT